MYKIYLLARFMTLSLSTIIVSNMAWAHHGDVILETPFRPLPPSDINNFTSSSFNQKKARQQLIHEAVARRVVDEQHLREKGLSTFLAHKATWAIAHKPQSICALYAMHLAEYHDIKYVRPDVANNYKSDLDQSLVKEIIQNKLCEGRNLNKQPPARAPYVKAASLENVFGKRPEQIKQILSNAGLSEKSIEDATFVVNQHPNSGCAWQIERILADEKDGDHNSDDEKDAVRKIEHYNACSPSYNK